MGRSPQQPGQVPAPAADDDGGAEFFAPQKGGYRRTDEAPPDPTGAPPPPQMPPAQKARPAQPAPPPKPKAKPKPAAPVDMSSPKDAGKLLAETVMHSFVDRLKAEAAAKGHLTVADLENMQAEFDRQARALSGVFEQSFEAYVKARERSTWDAQRNFPFDRLMVKKFSGHFKDGEALGPDDLCRRMLPGFFVALGMMLGPDIVDEYQEKVRGVVERVRASGKSVFNWEDVYADNTARGVALEAEIAIAAHFDEFEKRSQWFINLVNGHMPPPDPDAHANVVNWELTDEGFKKFLAAMLGDIRAALDTDAGKMKITQRYGADTCASLFDILKRA